jgi:glutaminyl-tRNA synthetase
LYVEKKNPMNNVSGEPAEEKKTQNFITQLVEEDVKAGKNASRVHTRFPPEPNGYLHIGHAKAICIDFGMARDFGGKTNLRFDDTNPTKEETEYVNSIKEDIKWLGFDWEDREFYASDYFGQLYEWAVKLIRGGKSYVDDQGSDLIAEQKGTPTVPGKESPFRNRTVKENLDLFERMKAGEFEEGAKVLRAKIDMASPNMHLRDPLMYRILKKPHHRTGDAWCIYPMYDYAHGQSDYIEGITHSICTLEFEVHRPLYNWFLDQIYEEGKTRPRQIEFARLNLSYTIMSKRKLLELVQKNYVSGWDDPRMPTLSGMRRRGYTPLAIRNFVDTIGVTKTDSVSDILLLEHSVREDLNRIAPRVMAVLNPLKMIITNFPEGKAEELETQNNPEDESAGTRMIPFSREIYIEQEDFMIDPPGKFFRLAPGKEVRLKSAYIVHCDSFKLNPVNGIPEEIYCTYFPETRSGGAEANRKVKGTLHWVSVPHAIKAEVRLYDRLFSDPEPDGHKEKDFKEFLNPDSLKISECFVEPGLTSASTLDHFQFQRVGYFNVDLDSKPGKLVFNRTVALKDSWTKV